MINMAYRVFIHEQTKRQEPPLWWSLQRVQAPPLENNSMIAAQKRGESSCITRDFSPSLLSMGEVSLQAPAVRLFDFHAGGGGSRMFPL